ncbi:MAG: iron-only hydrogenase system regulator [Planctomycetia bacterium]|nr:iron-only hydrogenase system regulator [Planctomycetia bacterium]
METRIAVIGIIVEDVSQSEKINDLLSEYRKVIVGRLGIPYEKKGVCVISVVLDAPNDTISALTGKIGRLPGITAKAVYSKK